MLRCALAVASVFLCLLSAFIFKRCGTYELYESKTCTAISNVMKIFIYQFVVIGILPLGLFGKLPFLSYHTVYESYFTVLQNEQYDDFNQQWYSDVGTVIIMTVVLFSFSIHVKGVMQIIWLKVRILIDQRCTGKPEISNVHSQNELNALYLGPKFVYETKHAYFLTICFVCIAFGSFMPVLYAIAALALLLFYTMEKIFFIRLYQRPPFVGSQLAEWTLNTLNLAVIIHVLFAIYAYSSSLIYNPTISTTQQTVVFNQITFLETQTNVLLNEKSIYKRLYSWCSLPFYFFSALLLLYAILRLAAVGTRKLFRWTYKLLGFRKYVPVSVEKYASPSKVVMIYYCSSLLGTNVRLYNTAREKDLLTDSILYCVGSRIAFL